MIIMLWRGCDFSCFLCGLARFRGDLVLSCFFGGFLMVIRFLDDVSCVCFFFFLLLFFAWEVWQGVFPPHLHPVHSTPPILHSPTLYLLVKSASLSLFSSSVSALPS